MKKNTFLYVLRLALTLLAITAIMAAALALVNRLTADRIAEVSQEKKEQAIRQVMRVPSMELSEVPFTDDTGLVKKVYRTEEYYYGCEYPADGNFDGYDFFARDYVVEVEVMGFNGPITMMISLDQGQAVWGLSIVSHTETAGLGAVAAADSDAGKAFRSQFAYLSDAVAVTKDGGEVDAITGATVTSRAICKGVNAALACVEKLQQEVGA